MAVPTFGAPIVRADTTGLNDVVVAGLAGGDILIYDGVDTWRNRVMSGDIAITSAGITAIQVGVITDADISPTAEIQVSKLLDGAARQLLQTDAAGTGVEWTDDIDVPGSLDVTDLATFDAGIIIVVGSLDLNNQGGLLNIGVAGNDFGAGQLNLVAGYIILGADGMTIQTTLGDIGFAPEASFNVLLSDEDADAFDLNDGTSSYYLINTLIAVSGVVAHTFDNTDIEFANIASASFTQVALTGYGFNVTGDADDITGAFATMLRIGAATLTSDTPSTNYTGVVSTVEVTPPIAGLNVILDIMAAIRILNGGGGAGTETIQYGIFIDTLTAGGTDIGISMANDLDLRSAGSIINAVAITASTIDATTDFTIDGLVLTADTITNDATLAITVAAGADITLGDDVVLLTIKGDGTVDINATSLDLLSSATLVNVGVAGQNITATGIAGVAGVSGNTWTDNRLSVINGNSGGIVDLRVSNTADDAGAGANIFILAAGSSASGDAGVQIAETGGASMKIGVDVSSSLIVWSRGGVLGTDDIIRVTDASPPVITYNAAHPTGTFDYVCEVCSRHSGKPFTCHRSAAPWHDDSVALVPVLAWADGHAPISALRHMADLGVMEISQNNDGSPWIGIRLQAAQWFTWSLQGQMSRRLDEHDTLFSTVDDRTAALEQAVRILTDQVVSLGGRPGV